MNLFKYLKTKWGGGANTSYFGAFTLAEVLITLGIIGVVAALTLPTLMANSRRQEASARLKKFYTTMYQAIITSESHNGPSQDWGLESYTSGPPEYDYASRNPEAYDTFMKYFAPYIKYTKIDKGKEPTDTTDGEMVIVYFADGSSTEIGIGACYDFIFDVNGKRKPNQFGFDRFLFYFCPNYSEFYFDNKNIVFGTAGVQFGNAFSTREKALNTCINTPNLCAKLLQKFDNWEFKDDYPYKL